MYLSIVSESAFFTFIAPFIETMMMKSPYKISVRMNGTAKFTLKSDLKRREMRVSKRSTLFKVFI